MDTPPPSSTTTSVVAVAQLCASNSKVQNLMEIAKCVAWAKQQDAKMLFLPENCGMMGGAVPGETLAQAEAPIGEEQANAPEITNLLQQVYENTLQKGMEASEDAVVDVVDDDDKSMTETPVSLVDGLRTLARQAQLWISIGGMHVRGAPPHPSSTTHQPRFFNTHVILDDTGAVRAVYRKIHLFDVCIPGKVNLMESNSTAAGQDIVVCDTPVGKSVFVIEKRRKKC